MHLALEKYLGRTDLFEEVKMLNIINYKLSELYTRMIIAFKSIAHSPYYSGFGGAFIPRLKLLNKLPFIIDY